MPRVDLSHFRTGSGPPLLLLHPLGMANIVWRPVVPLLAREREVIALDLPGFGASPQGPHTVEGLAHCVAAFAAGLGLERPHVAGNSLGGAVALAMGEAGTVGSVCALSPVGFASDREGTYARAVLAATRGISRVLLPVAATLARSAVMRTLLSSHAVARPWRIPPEDLVEWGRNYAKAAAFWDLLDAPRRLPRADADLPDHDRLGRPRPPADLLAPGAARSPHAPRRPASDAARLRARADVGRPRAGRAGDARGERLEPRIVRAARARGCR